MSSLLDTAPYGSVNGTALPIDELKAMESIDLSQKRLSIASVIVASCIKENGILKQLKCAACP